MLEESNNEEEVEEQQRHKMKQAKAEAGGEVGVAAGGGMHTRTELLCSCKNTALEHELIFRTATKQPRGEKHCNYQIIPICPFGVFRKTQ